jgi:hypothetical protein
MCVCVCVCVCVTGNSRRGHGGGGSQVDLHCTIKNVSLNRLVPVEHCFRAQKLHEANLNGFSQELGSLWHRKRSRALISQQVNRGLEACVQRSL